MFRVVTVITMTTDTKENALEIKKTILELLDNVEVTDVGCVAPDTTNIISVIEDTNEQEPQSSLYFSDW